MTSTLQSRLFFFLSLTTALLLALALYWIFFWAPVEPIQGVIQKIFYFHVPCAWAMFLATVCAAGGGVVFVWRQHRWGDEVLAASSELVVLFGFLVLATGPLWAKKAWGHYWVWDIRLTTMLILFLIFLAVLLVRRYGGPVRQRLAAGLAIFGAADVPLVYISVKLWRTIHPETSVVSSLPPGMRGAFFISLAAFTLLFLLLFWIRFQTERARNRLDDLALLSTAGE